MSSINEIFTFLPDGLFATNWGYNGDSWHIMGPTGFKFIHLIKIFWMNREAINVGCFKCLKNDPQNLPE